MSDKHPSLIQTSPLRTDQRHDRSALIVLGVLGLIVAVLVGTLVALAVVARNNSAERQRNAERAARKAAWGRAHPVYDLDAIRTALKTWLWLGTSEYESLTENVVRLQPDTRTRAAIITPYSFQGDADNLAYHLCADMASYVPPRLRPPDGWTVYRLRQHSTTATVRLDSCPSQGYRDKPKGYWERSNDSSLYGH